MKRLSLIMLGLGLAPATQKPPLSTATITTPALTLAPAAKAWSCSLSADTDLVPDDRDYAQPTITARNCFDTWSELSLSPVDWLRISANACAAPELARL